MKVRPRAFRVEGFSGVRPVDVEDEVVALSLVRVHGLSGLGWSFFEAACSVALNNFSGSACDHELCLLIPGSKSLRPKLHLNSRSLLLIFSIRPKILEPL